MISYEMAKKLKDSGFPQDYKELGMHVYCECCKDVHLIHWDNDEGNITGNNYAHRFQSGFTSDKTKWDIEYVLIPTLEELIEECGDEFESMMMAYQVNEKYWIVKRSTTEKYMHGSTGPEAVANLWLELHTEGQ